MDQPKPIDKWPSTTPYPFLHGRATSTQTSNTPPPPLLSFSSSSFHLFRKNNNIWAHSGLAVVRSYVPNAHTICTVVYNITI